MVYPGYNEIFIYEGNGEGYLGMFHPEVKYLRAFIDEDHAMIFPESFSKHQPSGLFLRGCRILASQSHGSFFNVLEIYIPVVFFLPDRL